MSSGLIALLDDVAAIAKVAASSLDDIAAHTAKAGAKAAGVVIDDAAVTPRYVTGFSPARELPIVAKIAIGSLRNKLLVLLPAALLLSLFAPWAITPLLMAGGVYLCFEGAEKVAEAVGLHGHAPGSEAAETGDPLHLEQSRIAGAIKTDFILSAEIMAITLASVPDSGFATQATVLAVVGILITVAVYGVVALIVKADDVGVALAANTSRSAFGALTRTVGRGLVLGMPKLLAALSIIGTAAMIWVGGGILVHGLAGYGYAGIEHAIAALATNAATAAPQFPAITEWLVTAAASGVVGLAVGLACVPVVKWVVRPVAARLG
jgi:hypothetical protein